MASSRALVPVVLEVGRRRTFATAVEWPGWSRSGKGEEAALEALAAYADRYRLVAAEAGVRFPRQPGPFDVVERLGGDATTDFGAPGVVADVDAEPLTVTQARRRAALVAAAWRTLDTVAAHAPAQLRKGPRGGGRDRDAVVAHVLAADAAYARTIGFRVPAPALDDHAGIDTLRAAVLDVLSRPSDGSPLVGRKWPARYAAQRIAWHALDHAWEIEDKSVSEV